MSSSSLRPENIPPVAIKFMNRTHREEVAIVNSLMGALKARLSGEQNDSEISRQLEVWLEHTEAHFEGENELMQDTGFPAFAVHSAEHENTLDRMQTVVNEWYQNKNIERLHDYVCNQWPAWFMTHVNTMDKVTAEFALTNGFSEE